MEKKMKIGIITLYRGYNYGTSLQAYALKKYLCNLGYESEIIWEKKSYLKGRDIRLVKILRMIRRSFFHPKLIVKTYLGYKNNFHNEPNEESKKKFTFFMHNVLKVKGLSYNDLKKFAESKDVAAIICGSDQIWNANTPNVDPLYYLRFVPKNKRIAYAPSFGSSTIPIYNKRIMSKYLKDIPNISVREKSGVKIVKKLIDREVPSLIDPTLLLDWKSEKYSRNNEDYILLYFLDEPSDDVINYIEKIINTYGLSIKALPFMFDSYKKLENVEFISAGPFEFVSLIINAKYVFTDSFHGTAFSVNLKKPFFTFERNYKNNRGQSSRIIDFLELVGLKNQYMNDEVLKSDISLPKIDFSYASKVLAKERKKSKRYLNNAISKCKKESGYIYER